MRLVKNCLNIGVIVYSPAASENNAIRATTTVLNCSFRGWHHRYV